MIMGTDGRSVGLPVHFLDRFARQDVALVLSQFQILGEEIYDLLDTSTTKLDVTPLKLNFDSVSGWGHRGKLMLANSKIVQDRLRSRADRVDASSSVIVTVIVSAAALPVSSVSRAGV